MQVLAPRFSLFVLLLFCTFARAQTAPPDWQKFLAPPAKLPTNGTVTVEANGDKASAQLTLGADGSWQVQVLAGPDSARTIVGNGTETRVLDNVTKRVQRFDFDALNEWFRGFDIDNGGPANLWLRPSPQLVAQNYSANLTNQNGQTVLELTANARGKYLQRMSVLVGGAGGGRYYAARKTPAWNRVYRVQLKFKAPQVLAERSDFDSDNRILQTLNYEYENALLKTVTVRDAENHLLSTWNYQWNATPAAANFALPDAPIIEENTPRDSVENDASSWWNRGVLQTRREDWRAALGSFARAAQLAPTALAAPIAQFDAALQVRDTGATVDALAHIENLAGPNDYETVSRRLRWHSLQRDKEAARADLTALAADKTPRAQWLRASGWRTLGDSAAAIQAARETLDNAATPANLAFDAAALLIEIAPANLAAPIENSAATNGAAHRIAARLLSNKIEPLSAAQLQESASDERALALVARTLEARGDAENATNVWQKIAATATAPLNQIAQRQLMAFAAQRGDAAGSLAIYSALAARLNDDEISGLQNLLFTSWDKSGNIEKFRAVLQNRAISVRAANSDARLWLAYQQQYASSDEVVNALKNFALRFGGATASDAKAAAWWQSALAEYYTGQAETDSVSSTTSVRDTAYRSALAAIDRAIKADPTTRFYPIQKDLIAIRRAARTARISDAGTAVAEREAAQKALEHLRALDPNDLDLRITSGIARVALNKESEQAIEDFRAAIGGDVSSPGAQLNLHAAMLTARQGLASALLRANNNAGALAEYGRLLDGARDSVVESAVALNALNVFVPTRDAMGAAGLSARLVSAPWRWSDTQAMLGDWFSGVARRPELLPAVRDALGKSAGEAAPLAAALIDFTLLQNAQAKAALPEATPETRTALNQSVAIWQNSAQRVQQIAAGNDAILSLQANALLAQDAITKRDYQAAATYFAAAIAREPLDLNLRLAYVSALAAAPANVENTAKIVATRDDFLLRAGRSSLNLRYAASMSLQVGRNDDAANLAREAYQRATYDDSELWLWRESAFLTARALAAKGDNDEAQKLLSDLSAARWDTFQRVAALQEAARLARADGKEPDAVRLDKQLQELDASADDVAAAAEFLRGLDG